MSDVFAENTSKKLENGFNSYKHYFSTRLSGATRQHPNNSLTWHYSSGAAAIVWNVALSILRKKKQPYFSLTHLKLQQQYVTIQYDSALYNLPMDLINTFTECSF